MQISMPATRGHRKASSAEEVGPNGGSGGGATATERRAERRQRERSQAAGRRALFVHVRVNRVHCRATYQVAPRVQCCNRHPTLTYHTLP